MVSLLTSLSLNSMTWVKMYLLLEVWLPLGGCSLSPSGSFSATVLAEESKDWIDIVHKMGGGSIEMLKHELFSLKKMLYCWIICIIILLHFSA